MNGEEQVREILRSLADFDREAEAPQQVEKSVIAAYRRKRAIRARRRGILVALAAAVVLAIVFTSQPSVSPAPVVAKQAQTAPTISPVIESLPQAPKAAATRGFRRQPQRVEITTPFVLLIEGDVLMPYERPKMVRVRLPMSAARRLGLPVREEKLDDRVEADVLMGEDGQARAIRFVKYTY
jgi:hypothetical protein